jgi:hypothetical protein
VPCFHVVPALSRHALAISVSDDGRSHTTPRGRGLGTVSDLAALIDIRFGPHGRTGTAELITSKPAWEGRPCC